MYQLCGLQGGKIQKTNTLKIVKLNYWSVRTRVRDEDDTHAWFSCVSYLWYTTEWHIFMIYDWTMHVLHKFMTTQLNHTCTWSSSLTLLAGCLASVQCDLPCYLHHDTFSWYIFHWLCFTFKFNCFRIYLISNNAL